jgi:autophagy-related protein 9
MAQQGLHQDRPKSSAPRHGGPLFMDPKERAMWRWNNVQDLDKFLVDVYRYFKQHGVWSILLHRLITLLNLAFMASFTTFVSSCVDWKKIPDSHEMSEIIIPQCTQKLPAFWSLVLWMFAFAWVYQVFDYIMDLGKLWNLHNFYHHLLDIPDIDIQSVTWPLVIKRLMDLRDANPSTTHNMTAENRKFLGTNNRQRMDAHDIANRLMRRENYLIALFNKDILNLTVPVPFVGKRQFFSLSIQWMINQCVMGYVFDEHEQVRKVFLTDRERGKLIETLRQRFRRAAILSLIITPFVVLSVCLFSVYRYFAEFYKDPAQLGARTFTPYAEWKFREFNELSHQFEVRKTKALKPSHVYLQMFPKDKTNQFFSFVAFVSGTLLLPLVAVTWLHSEKAMEFEITKGKNIIFWVGIASGLFIFARNALSTHPLFEDDLPPDPEHALQRVIDETHYCPAHWKGRLHSDEVRVEFSALYKMKILVFLDEMLSLIATPYVLWFSLPRSTERIVDFFREFTIHVDGLGHVCSFAVFDFQRPGENTGRKTRQDPPGRPIAGSSKRNDDDDWDNLGLRDDYYAAKDNKLMDSYVGFKKHYGNDQALQSRRFPGHVGPANPSSRRSKLAAAESTIASRRGTSIGSGRQSRQQQQAQRRQMWTSPRRETGRPISPIQSILLDPQHQPIGSGVPLLPLSPQQRAQNMSPLRVAGGPLAEDVEKGEDSPLGESWRTSRAGLVDESSGADDDDGDKRAGVLGMLQQLVQVPKEGRALGAQL